MASSQQHLKIDDIHDDLVFLKDGGVTAIIKTSAVNFSLLSEMEQIAIIESFAGLLNSLSFAIQIVIRSQRLDVTSYLTILDAASQKQTNPLLAQMITKYRNFVESMIKENDVLDKQFYIAINISYVEMGLAPLHGEEQIRKATTILSPRLDHIFRQLARIGLKSKQMTTDELIHLFYEIYNPSLEKEIPLQTVASPQSAQNPAQVIPISRPPIQPPQTPVSPTPSAVQIPPQPNPQPIPAQTPPSYPQQVVPTGSTRVPSQNGNTQPSVTIPRPPTAQYQIPRPPQAAPPSQQYAPTSQYRYPTYTQAVPMANQTKLAPPFVVEELPE